MPLVPRHRSVRIGLWLLAALVSVAGIAGAAGSWWLWTDVPGASEIASVDAASPSRVVAADGTVLDTLGARVQRSVALEQVSPHLIDALLVTEDKRFFEHAGVDLRRLAAAAWASACGDLQGGSTITQQLARNLFPERVGRGRSVLRKLRELAVAIKIERAYPKREILTMYLNRVPFLYNVTGIEMAAQTYFSKPAAELDRAESALLVAMLKGPHYYDPQRWPERARQRRDLVLTLMARQRPDAAAEIDQARAQPVSLQLQRHDQEPALAPHFVQQVRRQLLEWAESKGIDLGRDGLTIHTTLDTAMQALAEQAVRRQGDLLQTMTAREWSLPAARHAKGAGNGAADAGFGVLWLKQPELLAELVRQTPAYRQALARGLPASDALRLGAAQREALRELQQAKTRLEAGFVALDPRSGAVLAYVGSRDYAVDRFDHVGQAQRQPGSTFKPFVYGAALRAGISPWREYVDLPPQVSLADGTVWSPTDGAGASGEMMTLRAGLARSKNSITAQVMQQVGVAQVVRYAREMGIERAVLDPVPSLALGTSPVTLLEMARAYGTLASLGVRRETVLVSHIVDRHGVEVARFSSDPQRALPEEQAAVLIDILRDAVNHGTGTWLRTRFHLEADLAGKTGTTQRNTDGWFIAMRPSLVAGAWVGFNDPRVTMRSNQWGQGGRSALLIVGDFLQAGGHAGLVDLVDRFPLPPTPTPPALPPEPEADIVVPYQPGAVAEGGPPIETNRPIPTLVMPVIPVTPSMISWSVPAVLEPPVATVQSR